MCDCWYEGYQVGEVKPRGNFINHQSVPGAQRTSGLVFLSGVLLPHLYLLLQNEGKNTWESSCPDVCLSGGMCPDQRELWSEVSQSKNLPGPDNPGHHPPLHPHMAHYLLFLTRPNIIKSLVYPQYDYMWSIVWQPGCPSYLGLARTDDGAAQDCEVQPPPPPPLSGITISQYNTYIPINIR